MDSLSPALSDLIISYIPESVTMNPVRRAQIHTTPKNWGLGLNAHLSDFRALTFYSVNVKMLSLTRP